MKISEYNQMMSYLSDSFNPALTRSKVATLEQREGFATGGTYKDYVSRGEEYKDLTFEEWLQEDKPGYKPSEFGRVDKAIGGGVIEGEDLGTREGFAEAKFDDPSAGIKVGDDLGDGISQQRIKKDGSVVYKVYKGKVKYKELESRAIPSYEDAVAEREKYVPFKKGTKLSKKGIKNEDKWKKANPDLNFDDLSPSVKSKIRTTGRTDLGTIGQGKGQTLLKGKDSPFFEPLSEEGKKIAKKVYGTTDISDSKRRAINAGEVTMDTKPVKFQKGKDISLKMKKGSDVVTRVEFPEETINPEGKIENAKEMEKRFIKFIRNRVKFPQSALGGTGFSNTNIADEFPISEKQGGRLARYYIKKLGLKYSTDIQNPSAQQTYYKTKEKYEAASDPKQEGRITTQKTKILAEKDLVRKVDKAHRVSKTHMVKLGLQFDTNLIGMDSRIINQVVVKPSEIKMNNLYAKQRKLLELLEKNSLSEDLKNKMSDLNKQIKQVVKDTSGRLIGVTIDPNTLEPSFEGIKKKNTFSKFLGDNYKISDLDKFSNEDLSKAIAKAVDAEAKRGFVPNDFKNILSNKESQKAMLQYAKKVAPDAISGLKKAFLNPTSKVSMKLLSNFPAITATGLIGYGSYKGMGFDQEVKADDMLKPVDPGVVVPQEKTDTGIPEEALAAGTVGAIKYGPQLLKLAKNVGSTAARTVSAPVTAGAAGIAELTSEDPSLALAGAQFLYPELAKKTVGQAPKGFITNVLGLQGLAKFGKLGVLAARAPTLMTPLGFALTGAELVNQALKEQRRIEDMRENNPEAYQEFIAEQEDMLRESAAYGGIASLKND